jgi:hypothetical protein
MPDTHMHHLLVNQTFKNNVHTNSYSKASANGLPVWFGSFVLSFIMIRTLLAKALNDKHNYINEEKNLYQVITRWILYNELAQNKANFLIFAS